MLEDGGGQLFTSAAAIVCSPSMKTFVGNLDALLSCSSALYCCCCCQAHPSTELMLDSSAMCGVQRHQNQQHTLTSSLTKSVPISPMTGNTHPGYQLAACYDFSKFEGED